MKSDFVNEIISATKEIKSSGLYKSERVITSPQKSQIETNGKEVLNFCSNNYLGLSSNPELIKTAKDSLDRYGFGLSSVRFICGTQDVHIELEKELSKFLGTEDTILYTSCYDANGGLFETIMGREDAIISDSLNHASIIAGTRLSKAHRLIYESNNMDDLEKKLVEAAPYRHKLIATDGVFSMEGTIANLKSICDLADKHGALVMVDDSHAVGFVGKTGRGTHEYCDVMDRVDILTGTFGKALGGASGGYISGRKEIIEYLRQRSRPYLFSNTLAPVIAATTIQVLKMLQDSGDILDHLKQNIHLFRKEMTDAGFKLLPGDHAIIPVMCGDANLANELANDLLEEGIYVIGFSYPVVPKDEARVRVQISAAHTKDEIIQAAKAFKKVGKKLKLI